MEFVEIIVPLISNMGFPIAMCVACILTMNKQADMHKAEMEKVTQAVNNNTIALTQLIDKIEREK